MTTETEKPQHDVDDCIRTIVPIGGENYYLLVGRNFVMCTVPRENDPLRSELRMAVETICQRATDIMQEYFEKVEAV